MASITFMAKMKFSEELNVIVQVNKALNAGNYVLLIQMHVIITEQRKI